MKVTRKVYESGEETIAHGIMEADIKGGKLIEEITVEMSEEKADEAVKKIDTHKIVVKRGKLHFIKRKEKLSKKLNRKKA